MTWCSFCGERFYGDKALFNHWDNKLCPKHPFVDKRRQK